VRGSKSNMLPTAALPEPVPRETRGSVLGVAAADGAEVALLLFAGVALEAGDGC
jgi:hypothetical protein